MELKVVSYSVDAAIATITLSRVACPTLSDNMLIGFTRHNEYGEKSR